MEVTCLAGLTPVCCLFPCSIAVSVLIWPLFHLPSLPRTAQALPDAPLSLTYPPEVLPLSPSRPHFHGLDFELILQGSDQMLGHYWNISFLLEKPLKTEQNYRHWQTPSSKSLQTFDVLVWASCLLVGQCLSFAILKNVYKKPEALM